MSYGIQAGVRKYRLSVSRQRVSARRESNCRTGTASSALAQDVVRGRWRSDGGSFGYDGATNGVSPGLNDARNIEVKFGEVKLGNTEQRRHPKSAHRTGPVAGRVQRDIVCQGAYVSSGFSPDLVSRSIDAGDFRHSVDYGCSSHA